jgi:sulfatase maturation enzyme AslB (radical SAM superfamily)
MINNNIESGELISSAYCNMNCRYCYIVKNDELKKIHNNIVNMIKDNTLIDNLYDVYGENLTNMSIWGTEPTLTLPDVTKKIKYILSKFIKLKSFMFSTNMLSHTEVIHDFIEELNNNIIQTDREMKLELQLSLDGPKEITDLNRKENSTEIIRSNIIKLIKFISKFNFSKNFNIFIHFKPTMCLENIEFFINQNGIEKYFDFFEELLGEMVSIIDDNQHIKLVRGCSSTLMLPGMYTTEDGKLYSKFVEIASQKNISDKLNRKYKFIKNSYISYIDDLNWIFYMLNSIPYNVSQQTCSAGDSNLGVDQFKNIHMCHNTYNLVNKDYLKNIYDNQNLSYDVMDVDRITDNFMRENYVVDSNDDYQVSRILTVYRGFHDYNEMRISFIKLLIKELALVNQVDIEYLKNNNLTTLLAIFISKRFTCPATNLNATKSIHHIGTSVVRLLGNGAFQNMLKYYKMFGRIDRELRNRK